MRRCRPPARYWGALAVTLVTVSGPELTSEYHHAFEALPVGVCIIDRTGSIASVNRALEQQLGYTRSELVGQDATMLLSIPLDAIQSALRERADSAARATASAAQLSGRRKDGTEFRADADLRPFETVNGTFVVVSLDDRTPRRGSDTTPQSPIAPPTAVERLIADLSGQFINLRADEIGPAVRSGLGRICQLLDLDRATMVRLGRAGVLVNPVEWTAEGLPSLDDAVLNAEHFPWTLDRLLSGETVCFASTEDVPNEIDRRNYELLNTQSCLSVPLSLFGRVGAIAAFSTVARTRTWPVELIQRLGVIATVLAQVVARQEQEEALQRADDETNRLKTQLQAETVYLRHEARDRSAPTHIIGTCESLRRAVAQAEQVASTDSTVLLLGETGTGKELFASYIHSLSQRRARPMVRVNCAAIPAALVESELFGREKGAFTGALARQVGRFELADHSTIFLDEIGDLPLDLQVKLLRVLEERTFERLGSSRPISVDTRIICATHRSLEQRIADGEFREDLYYRLNVFPIQVPPLRERVEDIPALVYKLVEEFSSQFGKRIDVIEQESLAALQRYSWPGNIRELRNVVERAMIETTSRRLTIAMPESPAGAPSAASAKLADVEREHILAVLKSSAWRIRGASGAANRLGMKPTTLETRMAKLRLKRPDPS